MHKKHQSHPHGSKASVPTCDNCVHTFKHNSNEELVVCIPHLKTMPADHTDVCDLHVTKPPRA
jgi:hypothetical protein